MRTPLRLAAALLCLLPFAVTSAPAQETTGSISGTVTDPSGAAIRGATVTLTNTDRNHVERTLKTTAAGFFTANSLPLGTYSVQLTDSGFKTDTVTTLVLHANDALTVNRALVPGSETENVTVTADAAQLNLENATSAGLISGDQLNELVLNNRNYEQFLQLQPGVVFGGASDQLYVSSTSIGGASNQVNFSVNGGRNTSNNWTIDGADNVDRGANLTLLTYPSADAIAEVKTLRGQYSAEFGRGASGQIDVITKSGTNSLHGTAYEFFRNDVFNANTFGNKFNQPAVPRSKLRYNDFGGTIGGPVYIPHLYNGRDKTFFFFSDEARRVVQYTSGTAFVPTAAERLGDFTNAYYTPTGSNLATATGPVAVCIAFNTTNGTCTAYGSKIPTASISPTAAAYLKDIYTLIPAPPSAADIAAGLDPHALQSTVGNIANDNQIIVRIDQAVGQKLSVFYRYIHDTFPSVAGAGTFGGVIIPGLTSTITKNPGTEQLGHVTYVFSPTLLADIGYAFSTNAINTVPTGAFTTAQSTDVNPGLPYANSLGVIPTLSFTGTNAFSALGSTGIYNDYDRNHNAFGNVTKVFGRNTVILGVTYNHYQKQENSTGGNQGAFTFVVNTGVPTIAGLNTASQTDNAFANFLIGNANGGFSQASQAITANIQENLFEGYVQDNWKATPRLSLNLGVRYGFYGQPTDPSGRLSNFDPATYNPAAAPTIDSTGLICFTSPCANKASLNSGLPNAAADYTGINYINGLIFGGNNVPNHTSPYGNKIGQTDNTNFAPRFGFAYDLFGDGRTALRGGYGWSYDDSEVSYYETAVFNNPPSVTSYSLSTATLDNPTGKTSIAPTASTTPGRIVASPLNYKTPYIQQYSLDIQQRLSPTFALDIGYFGTHGTHLIGLVDINELAPNAFAATGLSPTDVSSTCVYTGTTTPAFISTLCDRGLNQIKPFKGYFAVDAVRSIFSSNYNSLQVKATRKFSGKSFIDANYTWSRDLTNSQNDYSTPPQNQYNINADYGRATDDRTNVIALDGVWELPWFRDQRGFTGHLIGGWELSGIYAINSGLPLTISESSGGLISYGYTSVANNQATGGYANDAAGLGILGNTNAGLRPNQIADPNQGYGQKIHTRTQWFYRGAFAAPLPGSGQVGNEKRGVVNGPGFNRLDVGLFRNFKVYENLHFQLRGEAFNAANHTNLANPGTAATTSSTFGLITTARDNRILQVAGKLVF